MEDENRRFDAVRVGVPLFMRSGRCPDTKSSTRGCVSGAGNRQNQRRIILVGKNEKAVTLVML